MGFVSLSMDSVDNKHLRKQQFSFFEASRVDGQAAFPADLLMIWFWVRAMHGQGQYVIAIDGNTMTVETP